MSLFGFGRPKHLRARWRIEFSNSSLGRHYVITSDSLMKMFGYLDSQIQESRCIGYGWQVTCFHRNGRHISIDEDIVLANEPARKLLSMAMEIDQKIVRAAKEPEFYDLQERGRPRRLELLPESMFLSIEERLQQKLAADASGVREGDFSIFHLAREVFPITADSLEER